eukprot:6177539-Pleurochrysis_carterae.AAC.1
MPITPVGMYSSSTVLFLDHTMQSPPFCTICTGTNRNLWPGWASECDQERQRLTAREDGHGLELATANREKPSHAHSYLDKAGRAAHRHTDNSTNRRVCRGDRPSCGTAPRGLSGARSKCASTLETLIMIKEAGDSYTVVSAAGLGIHFQVAGEEEPEAYADDDAKVSVHQQRAVHEATLIALGVSDAGTKCVGNLRSSENCASKFEYNGQNARLPDGQSA